MMKRCWKGSSRVSSPVIAFKVADGADIIFRRKGYKGYIVVSIVSSGRRPFLIGAIAFFPIAAGLLFAGPQEIV